MTEPASRSTDPLAGTLLRLVRRLLKGDAPITACADGHFKVGTEGRTYPEAVIRQAVSLGLVRRSPRGLSATGEAAGYVRRALLAGEEAFAEQHRDLAPATVELDGTRQAVRRNLNESPLAGLARLKDRKGEVFFPAEAIEAGERLHADFTRGQMQPRMTSSWEPLLSKRTKGEIGGMSEIAASAMEARRRFARAMEAMGPELSGVAADICCFGKGLELVERERQWPARSAKLLLRAALLSLARHYAPPPQARPAGMRHWGGDGFRPASEAFGTTS